MFAVIVNYLNRETAELVCAYALAQGVSCHVRQWFNGNRGWWVVRNEDYTAYVISEDLLDHLRHTSKGEQS